MTIARQSTTMASHHWWPNIEKIPICGCFNFLLSFNWLAARQLNLCICQQHHRSSVCSTFTCHCLYVSLFKPVSMCCTDGTHLVFSTVHLLHQNGSHAPNSGLWKWWSSSLALLSSSPSLPLYAAAAFLAVSWLRDEQGASRSHALILDHCRNRGAVHQPAQPVQGGPSYPQQQSGYQLQQPGGYQSQQPGGGYQAQPGGYYPPPEQQQMVPPSYPVDNPPPYPGPPEGGFPAHSQDSFPTKQAAYNPNAVWLKIFLEVSHVKVVIALDSTHCLFLYSY